MVHGAELLQPGLQKEGHLRRAVDRTLLSIREGRDIAAGDEGRSLDIGGLLGWMA